MPTINQLDAVSALQASDQIPVYSTKDADTRKSSLNLLGEYLQEQLTDQTKFAQQRTAPTGASWSVTATPVVQGGNLWLLLKPDTAFSDGAITLPAASDAVDGQQILVTSTLNIVTLAVTSAGASVLGAPTGVGTNGFFKLQFDLIDSAWYRIG